MGDVGIAREALLFCVGGKRELIRAADKVCIRLRVVCLDSVYNGFNFSHNQQRIAFATNCTDSVPLYAFSLIL